MLTRMTVHDFAIVEQLELEFEAGMTVLTGETGAGKSILIDALSLAVGERASASSIRPGSERADVTAVFDVPQNSLVQRWLDGQDLNLAGSECIVRRSLARDGRSRAYINERAVPVSTLRELGDLLVDIHGQHVHQSLLRRSVQQTLLDDFAGHDEVLATTAELYKRWSDANREMQSLSGPAGDREARLDLLRYQRQELEELGLESDEPPRLADEQRRLSHVSELIEAGRVVLERVAGESEASALSGLGTCINEIGDLVDHDPDLQAVHELLDGASIQLKEAGSELRAYVERLEPDPERLQYVDQRLARIHDLVRKHRVRPEELASRTEQLRDEISALENGATRVRELREEIEGLGRGYEEVADALHTSRERAARDLSQQVSANLEQLGMSGCELVISVELEACASPSSSGKDRVEYLVTTNPGQPPLPLAQVASGGELSRVSLALQVVTAEGTGVPTVIFDEVDVGIGGRVAEVVGQQLRTLGERRQVLCVTHLPQVASLAHRHLQVNKRTGRDNVRTSFERLAGEERVTEIARMLGGQNVTAQAIAHAREMLEQG